VPIVLTSANRQRLGYDEADMVRARTRIHEALQRLESGLRTLDSQLLHRVSSVVERIEANVGDTKAGVERMEKGIASTKAGIDLLHVHENAKNQTIEHQKIMDWICPSEIDYINQQNALTNRRQQGIGEWFVDTVEFRSWLHGNRATLLCSGKPGAGKTMTTSFVVSDVLNKYDKTIRSDLHTYTLETKSKHRSIL